MKNQEWKLKYQDLKLKFHDAVDVAFRLGMEQGLQQAQVQQAQQAQADAQAAQAAAMGQQPGDPNAQPGEEMNSPDGSELDQHIGQLESMLGSQKPGSAEDAVLQKSIKDIKAFQSSLKQASDLRKSEKAIDSIAKALKKPYALNKAANKNLSESDKKVLNKQEEIIENMMKSFADEEKKAAESINKTLNLEQLLKE